MTNKIILSLVLLNLCYLCAFSLRKVTNSKFLVQKSITFSHKANNLIDSLVKGDNIFRTHSAGAGFLGSILLFFPQAYMVNNPITEFAYQSWGIFILAVSAICFQAPSMDENTKTMLSRVLGSMCIAETLLYTNELLTRGNILGGAFFWITFSSVFIFASLSYGYIASGNTKIGVVNNIFKK